MRSHGEGFRRALAVVEHIQAEINRLENPYLYRSILGGFDKDYLAKVRQLVRSFDLAEINEYIKFSQAERSIEFDMYDGFVDSVDNETVSGWVVNLSQPEKKVVVEVRVDGRVVACGSSGGYRPDLVEAGYPSSEAGFAIKLPEGARGGFSVTVDGSSEMFHGTGSWKYGWCPS